MARSNPNTTDTDRKLQVFTETFKVFRERNGRLLSAATAYYVTLASAPLGVIALNVARAFIREETAEADIRRWAIAFGGETFADFIVSLIHRPPPSIELTVTGFVSGAMFLWIGFRLFFTIRRALNAIWDVPSPMFHWKWQQAHIVLLIRRSGAALFALVLGFCFPIMLASRVAVTRAGRWLMSGFPEVLSYLEFVSNFATIFVAAFVLLALVLKYLPDASVRWREACAGAAFTAILLTIGSITIGAYLNRSELPIVYGAAASFVMLLIWLYYSSQIFFLGAAFTWVIAERRGHPIEALVGYEADERPI
ncbi:MAG: YihY/virulence factor BrkB family protein [Polyangiales bacterium]